MAEPYCTVAVCLSTADRGRTILQWRISPELAHLFIAEFNERFGEPCGEGTATGEDVDAMVAAMNARTAVVQLYRDV